MIVVKLWGGLGNQLFQYAFGYAMAKKHCDKVSFDIEFYQNQPLNVGKREVEIEKYFSLSKYQVINRPKQVRILENRVINRLIRIYPGFNCSLPGNVFFVKEKTHTYMESIPYFEGKINYYDGYWQSPRYFDWCENDIRNEYTLKKNYQDAINPALCKIKGNSVSVHIRRGDYLIRKNLPLGYSESDLLDYYDRAISFVRNEVKNPIFYFFSDDIEWCRERYNYIADAVFMNSEGQYPALQDFYSMSKCENGIISASTFSWWAKWIGERNQGITIIPKGNYANDFFAEQSWIKL
ncbi:MAG: alpha-1,2-fucosyltransferase [Lachnospiraceae bacterium]|nr:alpha-1,2-fucosyltransferase [Lachnospiraceae bacterium]